MIRKIKKEDKDIFIRMTEEFYASPAVLHPIPEKNHRDAFAEIMRSGVYLEGYLFEFDGKPAGYAITAKSYSHEAGGITLWIDELFVLEEYRSKGIGSEFFSYLKATLDPSVARVRLEVESDNHRAIRFYRRIGFTELEYNQMYVDKNDADENP